MALSPPAPRKHMHTRTIACEGFRRDDGLWDIEARIVDTKTYAYTEFERGERAIGQPVHDMQVRLTLDDTMTVHGIEVSMNSHPYQDCLQAAPNYQRLVGKRIGPGWRKAVSEAVGGESGCTHVRELLMPMATVAFQTMGGWVSKAQPVRPVTKPYFLGGCKAWALDGKQVEALYPEFHVGNDPR